VRKSVLKEMDWFEEIKTPENVIVEVLESIEQDTFEIDLDRFDSDTFSIGTDY
jgi:hypothetical protein